MIKTIDVCKYYYVQGRKKHIFKNLNIEIRSGERLAILGKNGVGKSTLLRLLCGIEKPNSGSIEISGKLSWPVGLSSGFILNLTATENVKFVCRIFQYNKAQTLDTLNFVRSFAEIGENFDMPMQTYSSGMRSRVSFGLSMAFDFDYYIIDEAMSVGDPSFKKKAKDIFLERMKNKGMILVSHDINIITQFCNKGILLREHDFIYSNRLNEIIQLYKNPKPTQT